MNEQVCTEPGLVTTEDLLAYLDGEAPHRVIEHVKSCAHCTAAARAYRDAEQGLRQVLYRVDCPSPQTLGEYELNLVSATERRQIAAHVLACDRCTDELRTLREFMAGDLIPAQPGGMSERVRRIVAKLMPPAGSLALAGLRGTSEEAAQVYQAENLMLALEWRPGIQQGAFALVGLAMQEAATDGAEYRDIAGRPVRLISEAGDELVETTDELGNFQFDNVSPGAYRLEIDLDGDVIVVEDLHLSR